MRSGINLLKTSEVNTMFKWQPLSIAAFGDKHANQLVTMLSRNKNVRNVRIECDSVKYEQKTWVNKEVIENDFN